MKTCRSEQLATRLVTRLDAEPVAFVSSLRALDGQLSAVSAPILAGQDSFFNSFDIIHILFSQEIAMQDTSEICDTRLELSAYLG